ncbi:hypothetical protein FEM48_Zijuj12G0159500 [Ziziphus jujuba var. spinosa]|uniref:ferric-chelate reductase (NADH) n=1 Tax=Ziziphus jujuba var. spinosa TaxID=714518 RepID=A0A978UE96_ZIZJJ|nr:hypothetical protein FEM48_Zijuj12G0159500 [Ziziphus jujuba var. spinosa]
MKKSPSSQENVRRVIRATIKLLVVLVFMGTILIWIMMPTNTFRQKWRIQIRAKYNNSKYFGSQGSNLLIYTFPILFIAVLGCIYHHLGKNLDHNNLPRKRWLGKLEKPMLVKGPLGIVSGIELAFFIMFIALLIWSFSAYLYNRFAQISPNSAAKNGEKVWEAKLETSALTLGLVGNICLAFLFFPVARGSSVLPLLGLTSEASIKFHIWLGHISMVLFTAHGLSYIIYWVVTHNISQMIKWDKFDVSNLAGEIALACGLAMWATTIPRIRRKFFELFFYTHYLYIFFVIFFIFHAGISYSCIMLPGFYLFLVDRFLRFLQSRSNVRLISARILPCQAVELNFSKHPRLKFHPTSTMFINVPSVSKLQWHPFTITSNSNLEQERLSVMIKSEGIWSKKLYQTLSSSVTIDRLEVAVEGPYGPVSTYFLRHDMLVMVSGGSGITPFISIIRELIYASSIQKCKTPNVLLVCAVKNSIDLTMLDLILPLGDSANMSNLQLQIEAYVTREEKPDPETPALIRAIWFEPYVTDAPISATLGPNSWLWLGAIIASSFIIFLIIIGLVGCFYIYPIDQNSNTKFPSTLKALLNMLVICFSIALTASLGVLWNKKQNSIETKQIQNLDLSSPTTSRQSHIINEDRELESLPQQSLIQATNIHYGNRPNLKKILGECKGSSVGVLACGPKKLRHDVATICSSGSIENLHFESISFSW